MQTHAWMLSACLAAAWISQPPGRAHACTCPGPRPFGWVGSNPSNAATGVPRNQAIELGGDLDPETIELLNARGEPHVFKRRSYQPQGACERNALGYYRVELIPEPILEANTTYEIRAALRSSASRGPGAQPVVIQFGTSDDVLPDPELETPEGRLTLVAGIPTTCGPSAAIGCLEVDDPTDVEVVMRDGDTILQVLQLSSDDRSTELDARQMPTCIDVQRRAPTGRRSEPLSWCGSELELLPWSTDFRFGVCDATQARRSARQNQDEASSNDPEPMEAAPEHASYGCTTLPGARAAPFWTVFGLVALLCRRTRRPT